MAKAKKTESSTSTPAKKPAAAPKPAEKKAAPPAAAPAGNPVIDTSLAANAAAAMIGRKVQLPTGNEPAKKESGAFKQLKAGLNKPSSNAMGGAFAPISKGKKSNLGHGGNKQVGHNQTFGADVNRTGVPRRTGGG